MKVIYSCYGGAHSSPLAAAIHLGRIPANSTPSLQDIEDVLYFDLVDGDERGCILPVGIDKSGHEVYVLGRGPSARPIEQAIISGYLLAGEDPRQLLFVNSLQAVNWLMRIGGFLSRRLGLVALGRPLAIRGAKMAFSQLAAIVEQTKKELEERV